ncbi:cytochrome P450 94A1-like [Silene latifolia]|uniref:cytochrome P450 94A1-like n=1 Tax=Silene latifolia TaxID=37657 RepID=UPI003D76FBD4
MSDVYDNFCSSETASLEFTHKAVQKFVENVVDSEISKRLIPFLSYAAKENKVIDLQDLFKRFTFDTICEVSFGYNPGYVSPALPDAKFMTVFGESILLSYSRFHAIFPIVWKACRFFNIGSEKRLKDSIQILHEFAKDKIKSIKQNSKTEIEENSTMSRLIKNGRYDEKLGIDMLISFVLAGQDTSSSALTWFFWLVRRNNQVEQEILKEINNKKIKKQCVVDELKGMTYTHAALSETMRLYPPVAVDLKQAQPTTFYLMGPR